jgi:putative nucleotidyltransferase with HDIG domain
MGQPARKPSTPRTQAITVLHGGRAGRKSHSDYSRLLERLQNIPTLPMVAMKVNELINDPNSSGAEIADVMKKDQVLTAKVLRLVNSAYYAVPGGVSDVQRALAFLGFNTVAQLVLGLSVFSTFSAGEAGDSDDFSMLDFWRHALGTAVCCEILAKKLDFHKPEEAFACGLLHDIGKLALHEVDREKLVEVVRQCRSTGRSFLDVEREMDLPGHSFMGETVAAKWGLPQTIRLAIRYHHFDVSKMDSVLASAKPFVHIVRLANQICVKNGVGHSGDCSGGSITPDMLSNLGLKEDDIPGIEQALTAGMERAGAFLNAYR